MKKIVDLHRYVGLGICIFLVHLAITGIFLNHSIGLRLDKTFITWPWLLNQYNLTVPEPANIFTIGKNNFSTIDGEVFFNDKPIFLAEEDLLGVSQNQDTFILASSSTITVISKEGYIINKENVLPFTVKNIGINGDEVVINDSEDKIWSSESINGVWELTQNRAVQWSMEGSITPINHEKIRKYFVGDGVSLEQLRSSIRKLKIPRDCRKYGNKDIAVDTPIYSGALKEVKFLDNGFGIVAEGTADNSLDNVNPWFDVKKPVRIRLRYFGLEDWVLVNLPSSIKLIIENKIILIDFSVSEIRGSISTDVSVSTYSKLLSRIS